MRAIVIERSKLRGGTRLDFPYNFQIKHLQRLNNSQRKWVRLADLSKDICDGLRKVDLASNGVPFLKLGNLSQAEVLLNNVDLVDSSSLDVRFQLEFGDILLSKIGDDPRAALVRGNLVGGTFASDIYRLRVDSQRLSPVWVEMFLNSRYVANVIFRQNYGTTVRRLSISDLRNLRIPIPPPKLSSEVELLEAEAHMHSEAASKLFSQVIQGIFSEIDQRGDYSKGNRRKWIYASNHWLFDRWDFSYMHGRGLTNQLESVEFFKPLGELAKIAVSSRKTYDPSQLVRYVQVSDIDAQYMTFGNVRQDKVENLSARIRLPLKGDQVLVLASGSNLGSREHPIAVVEHHLDGCLTSNAFIALEFQETPIYYGLVMRHPLVLAQLKALAAGSVISFISKRAIENVLLPILGQVWRKDFNDRAKIAWEKRSHAIRCRQKAIGLVDDFITSALGERH
jgi:restriction endonuclease S subunit